MSPRAETQNMDELDSIERQVQRVLVPVQAPPEFARHLRTGLLASVSEPSGVVVWPVRRPVGPLVALIGGLMSALTLVLWWLVNRPTDSPEAEDGSAGPRPPS
jgi:hypothetical protein